MSHTYTIPQKQSGTGTIYDLASDQFDIDIEFGDDEIYAVIAPSYYGLPYTCHNDDESAIRAHYSLVDEGYKGATIINRDGEEIEYDTAGWSPALFDNDESDVFPALKKK